MTVFSTPKAVVSPLIVTSLLRSPQEARSQPKSRLGNVDLFFSCVHVQVLLWNMQLGVTHLQRERWLMRSCGCGCLMVTTAAAAAGSGAWFRAPEKGPRRDTVHDLRSGDTFSLVSDFALSLGSWPLRDSDTRLCYIGPRSLVETLTVLLLSTGLWDQRRPLSVLEYATMSCIPNSGKVTHRHQWRHTPSIPALGKRACGSL